MENLNQGMWILGLAVMPVIMSIISFIIAVSLIFNMKKKHKKSIPKIIITIILLSYTIYMIFSFIAVIIDIKSDYNPQTRLCQNIENLNYKIEPIDKWTYDIYIYDNDGNYYEPIENYYLTEPNAYEYNIETKERCVFLYKLPKKNVTFTRITLKDTAKFYIKDPIGNKILIWDYNDYISAFAIQNLEIEKVNNTIYITENSLKNITIDYNDVFFDYSWVIRRNGVQILSRAIKPQNLTLNLLDLKEEFYKPSGSYEIYLETYSKLDENYIKASNSIIWSK